MFVEIYCRGDDGNLYTVLQEQEILSYNTYQGAEKSKATAGYSLKGSDALVKKVGNHFIAHIGPDEIILIPV